MQAIISNAKKIGVQLCREHGFVFYVNTKLCDAVKPFQNSSVCPSAARDASLSSLNLTNSLILKAVVWFNYILDVLKW